VTVENKIGEVPNVFEKEKRNNHIVKRGYLRRANLDVYRERKRRMRRPSHNR